MDFYIYGIIRDRTVLSFRQIYFWRKVSSTRVDFNNPHSLDDSDYKILTGLSKDRLDYLT